MARGLFQWLHAQTRGLPRWYTQHGTVSSGMQFNGLGWVVCEGCQNKHSEAVLLALRARDGQTCDVGKCSPGQSSHRRPWRSSPTSPPCR